MSNMNHKNVFLLSYLLQQMKQRKIFEHISFIINKISLFSVIVSQNKKLNVAVTRFKTKS